MPFHALAGDRIWSVFDDKGEPSRARATSVRAKIDESLLAFLHDPVFRARLRRLLIATYFPADEQVALCAALGMKPSSPESPEPMLEENAAVYRQARAAGRSARFKTEVVTAYRFTCALTGYRLTTVDQTGIVEAAHIHAHAKSRNDDPDNGLALSPTAHALFDRGLWSVTDDLRVLVKPETAFTETSPVGGFSLRALSGRPLCIPSESKLRPHPVHLRWHRCEHQFERSR